MNKPENTYANDAEGSNKRKKEDRKKKEKCRWQDKSKTITTESNVYWTVHHCNS